MLYSTALKIKDINYIGEKSNVPKEYSKCKCSRHYIRKFDKNKKCSKFMLKSNPFVSPQVSKNVF